MEQLIANAVFSASIYALVGAGFSLVYRCGRFFHFAHGVIFTAGAYASLLLKTWFGLPLEVAVALGVALATFFGCAIEFFVYRPLRRRGTSSLGLLLASLGVYVMAQNIFSLAFGDDTKILRVGESHAGIYILGATVTSTQLGIVATAIVALVLLGSLLSLTRLGRSMRAVANDVELARIFGIEIDRVILYSIALGSCLGGVAGVLVGLDVNMVPTMGMRTLLMSVVAVVIGGGGLLGVSLGALFVGLLQHLGVWHLPTQWQDAIVFFALILFLVIRPQGFLGRPVRKATI